MMATASGRTAGRFRDGDRGVLAAASRASARITSWRPGDDPSALIATYERFATPGQMMPEQVWDEADRPDGDW